MPFKKKKTFAKKTVDKKQTKQINKLTKMISATDARVFITNPNAYATISNGFAVIPITQTISQGDAVGQRAGSSIFLKKMHVNLSFRWQALNTATVHGSVRYLIIRSTSSGIIPTAVDTLNIDDMQGVPAIGELNKTVQIVRDRIIAPPAVLPFSTVNNAVAAPTIVTTVDRTFKFNVKCNKRVNWMTDGVDTASIGKGHYWLLVCQQNTFNATTANIDFSMMVGCTFTP